MLKILKYKNNNNQYRETKIETEGDHYKIKLVTAGRIAKKVRRTCAVFLDLIDTYIS